jgi:hypothetical protein
MDTVGVSVPARQIREFFTFIMSFAEGYSLSARCTIPANDM